MNGNGMPRPGGVETWRPTGYQMTNPLPSAAGAVVGQGCEYFRRYSDFAADLCGTLGAQYVTDWLCQQLGMECGQASTSGSTSDPSNLVDTTGPKCPEGQIRIQNKCVDLMAAPPGGQPFISQAAYSTAQGAFGMPAVVPEQEMRRHLKCPRGMVLGYDEMCYPKAVLPRRSQFRKWKGARRPPVSVKDAQAIRRAEQAKDRVKKLAKNVGFSVKKR